MRNNNRRLLIIVLTTIMIFGGISPLFFVTAQQNQPPQLPKLHIEWVRPAEKLEGIIGFEVYVVNEATHVLVQGATVYVETANHSDSFSTRTTDNYGIAEWDNVLKLVDYTTIYQVWATKSGYVSSNYGNFIVTNRALHFVDIPTYMNEQTSDSACVKDQYNNNIECWVDFQGVPYLTYGCTSIYAFDVTAEDVLVNPWVPVPIYAYKTLPYPYNSDYDIIMVKDLDNIEVTLDCDVNYALGGDPVYGATVNIIVGGEGRETTDQSGECQFSVFPDTISGTFYILLASYPGYWPDIDWKTVQAIPESSWYFYFSLAEIPWWIQNIVNIDLVTAIENTEVGSYTVELGANPSSGLPGSYTYEWDFGDSQLINGGESISHDYYGTGSYIIKVTATSPTLETGYGELHLTIR